MATTIPYDKRMELFAHYNLLSLTPAELAFMTQEQIKEHIKKAKETLRVYEKKSK